MTRIRLSTFLLAGATALAVAIPASLAAATAGIQVPLVVPPSAAIAIQAVKLRVTGPGAPKLAVPDRLQLRGATLPTDATAMVAMRTSRTDSATTITLLAITVSRSTKPSSGALPTIGLTDGGAGVFTLAAASARKPDAVWQANRSFAVPIGCTGCRVQASAVGLVDTGKTTPAKGAALSKALRRLLDTPDAWDPLVKPGQLGGGTTLGVFSAAHPTGRPLSVDLATEALASTQQLLQGPTISVRDEIYEAIDETSACITDTRRCGSYVFTFKGAKETTIRSDDPSFHKTTTYSGRTCGRTPFTQAWKITSKSNNAPPVTRTIDLAKTRVIFTDSATGDGATGTAIHKLYLLPGVFPGIQAIVDSTGVWSSDLGSGITVPLTVTKLAAGKRC